MSILELNMYISTIHYTEKLTFYSSVRKKTQALQKKPCGNAQYNFYIAPVLSAPEYFSLTKNVL